METGQKTEASVWRLGPQGLMLNSFSEESAASLCEKGSDYIFFFAELVTDASE